MKALKINNGWWRGVLALAILWLAVSPSGLALPMTAVQGVVYRADGSTAKGTLLVSWPAFTASDGSAVAAGSTTATIAGDGTVSLALTPNAGATPQGTYYTVVYHLTDGTVSTEYWVVPQAATATIAQMRARVVPAAVAQQTVSQQYVDSSISAIQGNYLQLQGGTMNGALNLSSDPVSGLQAATKQYVDSSIHTIQGNYLPLQGGTMSGTLNLSTDPVSGMQAATKQYVDAHAAANLPVNAIPYQGTSGSTPVAATPANIASLYRSAVWGPGQATEIATTFNEGSAGASLAGTNPATDVSASPWAAWPSVSGGVFAAGGGVSLGSAQGNYINSGANDSTVTWTGITNTASFYYVVRFGGTVSSGYLAVKTQGPGGVSLLEINNGVATTVGSSPVANGTSGSIVVTVSGSSVTVTPFGGAQITYTIPAGHQALSGQDVGFFNVGSVAQTVGGMTVTVAGTVSSPVACAGFMNQDGTCSAPAANNLAAADGSGHFVALPEKGTKSVNGVGFIAWQDDLNAGIYDPRDPRWGAQDTPAHQAAALQVMSNRMACDLSMGKVQQAVAKFPQGTYRVDQLQMAPGSVWMGAESASAGTTLRSLFNNHQAAQMPISLSAVCADGQSHTDSKTDGVVSYFFFQGCSQGGCSNAAGDTANYQVGGPGNNGMEMSNSGQIDHVNAQAFGGYGIRVDSMDSKAFHLRTGSGGGNDSWYYYGGYKGVTETAGSPESNGTTIAGSTGSVALSWTAVPSATGYVLYRGTSPGAENTAYILGNVTSATDTCAAGATGILGTVTNVVTNSLATPAAPTATPSETGGTCAAGTYYYKITATKSDGWHGSVELIGTDIMADWVEAYGFSDDPTVYTYHHIADILSGGGGSHFDHFWPQLGQVGIAQPSSNGVNDHYENIRIDFTRLEGMFTQAGSIHVDGGLIQGSCKSSVAQALNTGQISVFYAGTCNQFFTTDGTTELNGVQFANPGGFGPYYSTGDILNESGITHNTNGSFQFITNLGYMRGHGWWEPSTALTTNVTANAQQSININGLRYINPSESTPTTYNRFVGGAFGQDVYIQGGNANVTLSASAGFFKFCNSQSINLGNVTGFLHFVNTGPGADLLAGGSIAKEVCNTNPTVASSETVTFSATPIFSIAKRASITTLTGNITGFTLAAGVDGQEKTLTFCQNATGGYTVTAPANVRGFMTVGTTASKCSSQHFTYSAAQAAWLADSAGVTNE